MSKLVPVALTTYREASINYYLTRILISNVYLENGDAYLVSRKHIELGNRSVFINLIKHYLSIVERKERNEVVLPKLDMDYNNTIFYSQAETAKLIEKYAKEGKPFYYLRIKNGDSYKRKIHLSGRESNTTTVFHDIVYYEVVPVTTKKEYTALNQNQRLYVGHDVLGIPRYPNLLMEKDFIDVIITRNDTLKNERSYCGC